ncbi:hypothetical protein PM082_019423 [Marasmius tenuissimus]|nr:hypothetical protein PM082_019423 [Marasmius tenuissimus]
MSQYFRDARLENVMLNHPNFNNVQGDQYNNMTKVVTTTRPRRGFWIWRTKQEAEFEQLKDTRDMTHKKEWMRDFKEYSRTLRPNHAYLFGINHSRIPMLIFPGELVPAAHFMTNVGELGWAYFSAFAMQLGCEGSSVWMDAQRGVLCRGLWGPDLELRCSYVEIKNLPSTIELLQEDVCFRFFTCFKSKGVDRDVIDVLSSLFSESLARDFGFKSGPPTIFSTSTHTPIGVATGACWSLGSGGTLLVNGLTRFTLHSSQNRLFLFPPSELANRVWLSQASSIFHALGIPLEDDLSQYKLIVPEIYLEGSISQTTSKRRRRCQQPIYLFIRPLPSTSLPSLRSCTTPSLHYWSFDEEGQSRLSANMHRRLGLPITLELKVHPSLARFWSSKTYGTMYQYQIARGFDPTTADFAQSLGYPLCNPSQDDSNQFEEVDVVDGLDPFFATKTDIVVVEIAQGRKRPLGARIKQWGRWLKLKPRSRDRVISLVPPSSTRQVVSPRNLGALSPAAPYLSLLLLSELSDGQHKLLSKFQKLAVHCMSVLDIENKEDKVVQAS